MPEVTIPTPKPLHAPPPDAPVEPETFFVEGEVVLPNGKPISNCRVKALDRGLGAWRSLGAPCDVIEGRYRIDYSASELQAWGKTRADLKVEVYGITEGQPERLLAVSPLILQARPQEVLNFAIGDEKYRGPDEYSRLEQALARHLTPETDLDALEVADILILEREAHQASSNIAYYVKARRWSREPELGLAAPLWYALLRQGQPTQQDALFARPLGQLWASLERAKQLNLIDLQLDEALKAQLSSAQKKYLQQDTHPYAQLLASTSLLPDHRETFTQQLTAGGHTVEGLWQALGTESGFDAAEVLDLQQLFELQSFTGHNTSLTLQLRATRGVRQPRAVAALSLEEWRDGVLVAEGVELPDEILPGAPLEGRRAAYAEALYRSAERRYPTRSLTGQLRRSTTWPSAELVGFLEAYPDVEFTEQRVTAFLAADPAALERFADPEAGRRELYRLEQFFHVTPPRDKRVAIEALWATTWSSAPQLAAAGRGQLTRTTTGQLPTSLVNQIYQKAVHRTARALDIYLRFHPSLNRISLPVMQAQQLPEPDETERSELPEWADLFGSTDTTECSHCESAVSPAAYLIHLLAFLQRASDGVKNGLEALLERRPDIGLLQLNCENTDTLLPKIDLALEMMEQIVVYSPDATTLPHDTAPQTTEDSALLLAQPEHLERRAYEALSVALYPFRELPFHLWTEEGRRYLKQMNLERQELMRMLPPRPEVGPTEIAAEALSLSPLEVSILTTPITDGDVLAPYWGIDLASGTLIAQLSQVETLLRQAKLDYETLLRWLDTRHVNPKRDVSVEFASELNSLEGAVLVGGGRIELLDRLHRSLRLQRRTGWTESELDAALRALGLTDLGAPNALVELAGLQALRAAYGLTVDELCSWWRKLDTYVYSLVEPEPSQYECIFLDLAVFPDSADANQVDLRRDVFALTPDGTDLVVTTDAPAGLGPWLAVPDAATAVMTYVLQSEYAAHVQAATGLGAADLLLLVVDVLPKASGGEVALNLSNLSELYRIASFTRALEVSVTDYLRLIRLTGLAPLATSERPGTPARTQAFTTSYAELLSGPASVEELSYLLLHEPAAALVHGPTSAGMDTVLTALSAGFQGIIDLPAVHENAGWRASVIQSLSAALALDSLLLDELLFTLRPTLGHELLACLVLHANPDVVLPEVMSPDFYAVYERLHKFGKAWTLLELDATQLGFVINRGPALGWSDLVDLPLAPPASAGFAGWSRLATAVRLQGSLFGLEQSLFALVEQAVVAQAPVPPPEATPWVREEFLVQTSAWTGWSLAELTYLTGPEGFQLVTAADFASERWLANVERILSVLQPLGVSVAQARAWTLPVLAYNDAQSAKQALRIGYDETTWLSVLASVQDELRELRRDALLGYLKPKLRAASQGDFYSHYLIDPAFAPIAQTSRLLEATASVQLFVQRILFNLEPSLSFPRAEAATWAWRQNYRLWEAGQKVFLYPENFLLPEVRDNKSVFFKELEAALLQSDVTSESAERLYRDYLLKLDAVSRLEMMGMYQDDTTNVLHVFGRTRDVPQQYYYRRWEDKARWTPWEKVELDIQGDNVVPVVYNGRLYLFWATFELTDNEAWIHTPAFDEQDAYNSLLKEKALLQHQFDAVAEQLTVPIDQELVDEMERLSDLISEKDEQIEKGVSPPPQDEEQRYHVKVEVAWSQHFNGTWSGKRVCVDAIAFDSDVLQHFVIGWVSSSNHLNLAINRVPIPGVLGAESSCPGHCYLDDAASGLRFSSVQPLIPDAGVNVINAIPFHGQTLTVLSVATTSLELEIGGQTRTLIEALGSVLYAHQYGLGGSKTSPFFFTDDERTYFVEIRDPWLVAIEDLRHSSSITASQAGPTHYQGAINDGIVTPPSNSASSGFRPTKSVDSLARIAEDSESPHDPVPAPRSSPAYRFHRFYQPYAGLFLRQLSRYGVEGLLNPDQDAEDTDSINLFRQQTPLETFSFEKTYSPNEDWVDPEYPVDEIDFDHASPYGGCNWELFFHIPLLIATRLMDNQRFAEARTWLHYIFDPTHGRGDGDARFWKIKPFFAKQYGGPTATLQELLDGLASSSALDAQLAEWEAKPFQPHAIARLRTPAYMKATLMMWLDNAVSEADWLFARDDRESLGQAALLYTVAGDILGPKPTTLPPREALPLTPNQLLGAGLAEHPLDGISLQLADPLLDSFELPYEPAPHPIPPTTTTPLVMSSADTLCLLCLPENDKLLGYWDIVADRLFKLRNSMTLDGQVRQLPLFAPPIDPMLLVRASAAGLDLTALLSSLSALLPNYRFSFMLQRALELCGELRNFGGALLAALEKQDAEQLSVLRSSHEVALLRSMRDVKQKSLEEAGASLAALQKSLAAAEARAEYYSSRIKVSSGEQESLDKQREAAESQTNADSASAIGAVMSLIPQLSVPLPKSEFGGIQLGAYAELVASGYRSDASILTYEANQAATSAGYDRRQEDWDFQAAQAKQEMDQLDEQILAAEIREQLAQREIEIHDQQKAQAEEVQALLDLKFTNESLYGWMVSKLSAVYFQLYQLALKAAQQAEATFQHELPVESADSYLIQAAGYWDSLKKGLLAGEALSLDLRRLEAAYHEGNSREREITEHVSLAALDPSALLALTTEGECLFSIPEAFFDLEYPGHFLRRLKSVSLSIPCVTGPYTTIGATLTLQSDSLRLNTSLSTEGVYASEAGDGRFRYNARLESISVSAGQNDGGVFELNLRDERYLPFEGRGTIGTWTLRLDSAVPMFDWSTITDAVVHLRYTARDGGEPFRATVIDELNTALGKSLRRGFSAKREFPTQWHAFLHSAPGAPAVLELDLASNRFPYFARNAGLKILGMELVALVKDPANWTETALTVVAGARSNDSTLKVAPEIYAGQPKAAVNYGATGVPPGAWTLSLPADSLGLPEDWDDFICLVTYEVVIPASGARVARRSRELQLSDE